MFWKHVYQWQTICWYGKIWLKECSKTRSEKPLIKGK